MTNGAQILKFIGSADVTVSGGFSYKGTYNSATAYALYDVVRVQSGGSQGVWCA